MEKLVGTLFLQEILLPSGAVTCDQHLERLGRLFSEGSIYDWNACDWFCVKVLGPLITREGKPCAHSIASWKDSCNLWKARASLVAFVPVAANAAYCPLIESGCRTVIRRPERFANTAVGWILREISKTQAAWVRRVVTKNIDHFSAESLNNTIKNFSQEERKAYRQLLRDA